MTRAEQPTNPGGATPSFGGSVSGSGRRPNISIKDVAASAGVSIATVSRVLNTPSLVAPGTAERVQKAVRELGYRPNLFAKGLMTRRSRVLGVSIPEWQGDSFSDVMRGAESAARSAGYHLLVSANAHKHLGDNLPPSFALDLIDGLVTMVTRDGPLELESLEALDIPVVVLGSNVESDKLDTIVVDNLAGTRHAVEHLLEGTPADRCYFVGGPAGNTDSDQRCRAFVDALAATGHAASGRQINRGQFAFDFGWDWAAEMHRNGKLRGSAVFAGNDEIAVGISHRAREEHLTVPTDLRIIGFDDSRYCSFILPSLSSVRVPSRQLGGEAVNQLIRRIEQPDAPIERRVVRSSLVVRESSYW
jgi:DNA-binding LacI/PurR family transcriptional regulator